MYFFMAVLILISGLTVLKMHVFPTAKAGWVTEIPIAHRGFFDNAQNIPENSLMAFGRAVERGYAIELDVMLTKDGQVIVYHDHDLKRLSGVDKRVEDLTLDEIQTHKLLNTDEFPPTLQQVLELVDGRVPLYIEIKHEGYAEAGALEENVAEVLEQYEGRVAVLSYNPPSLEWFAQNAPQYYRGQNFDPPDIHERPLFDVMASAFKQAWMARGHFFVYGHATMPKGVLRLFSLVRPLISHGVNSQADYNAASVYANNVIFERLNL